MHAFGAPLQMTGLSKLVLRLLMARSGQPAKARFFESLFTLLSASTLINPRALPLRPHLFKESVCHPSGMQVSKSLLDGGRGIPTILKLVLLSEVMTKLVCYHIREKP